MSRKPTRPRNSTPRIIYLIARWCPSSQDSRLSLVHRRAVRAWNASLKLVRVYGSVFDDTKRRSGRTREFTSHWAFSFPNGLPDDDRANRIADTLDGMLHLVYGPMISEPITAYRLPTRLVGDDGAISAQAIMKDDRNQKSSLGEVELSLMFGRHLEIPAQVSRQVWSLLPSGLDDRVRTGALFYRASVDLVWFSPGDVYDMLRFDEADLMPE